MVENYEVEHHNCEIIRKGALLLSRSPMQTEVMQFLRWMRMAGDTVFAIGALAFVYFAMNLIFRPQKKEKIIGVVPETA